MAPYPVSCMHALPGEWIDLRRVRHQLPKARRASSATPQALARQRWEARGGAAAQILLRWTAQGRGGAAGPLQIRSPGRFDET